MTIYLLKLSACLLVFWMFYLLLLERQKMHQFKRFYLLGALLMALVIPLLSITYYIEPVIHNFDTAIAPVITPIDTSEIENIPVETTALSLETILWLVYSCGVLLFATRFLVNLFRLYQNIAKHEIRLKQSFVYVLLKEYRIPHSFFKYIFLNQSKFERNAIPKEVLLHEETHAKQLHSLDIIILEVLQIVFWFHPLIYVLKHHIKLNHEFLADQAVLEQGTDTKNYQTILLQFSSNIQEHQFLSAINYSSFKKRFTVMKSQTSKTKMRLSRLLLLPIAGLLFYSFADKVYVEKDNSTELSELDTSSTESDLFYATVEKTKNSNAIALKCEYGCKWSHLILEPNTEPYIINDYGFSKGKTLETDKFAFSIKTDQSSNVSFSGLKGTKWTNLNVTLLDDTPQAINQSETTNYMPKKKTIYKGKTLDIRAINDKLKVNNVYYDVNSYARILNKITKHWTRNDYKLTTPELEIEGCSQDFLDTLDSEFRASDYYLITIQGIKEATPKMMQEYRAFIETYKKTKIIYGDKYNRAVIIYEEFMSDKQRALVEKYPSTLDIPNVSKTKQNPPTRAQFEAYKDAKTYAIWIDGKHVPNSILEQYSVEDFVHHSGSIVHKNARSVKFPQPNQYHLYTKKGFEKTYKDSQVRNYKNAAKKYTDALELWLKEDRQDNSELKILKTQADAIYKTLPIQQIKDHNLKTTPPIPADKKQQQTTPKTGFYKANSQILYYTIINGETTYYNRKGVITDNNGKELIPGKQESAYSVLPGNKVIRIYKDDKVFAEFKDNYTKNQDTTKVSVKQLVAYNKWAKALNEKPVEQRIIKLKDFKYYENIYNLMSTKQKASAQPFPIAPPPPPPPPPAPKVKTNKNVLNKLRVNILINGKDVEKQPIELTKNELRTIQLSTRTGDIKSFKFKIPGKPTQALKGNTLKTLASGFLTAIRKGDYVTIFDAKDGSDTKIKALVIKVIN